MPNDDRDLRESFAALRREVEAHVPPISILAPPPHKRGYPWLPGKLAAGAIGLAILIAAAVWLLPGFRVAHPASNRDREQATASITSWKPATDFLLDTPGRELLQGVPEIGVWHGMANEPNPGESPRPFKQQRLP
jgi:hypothetical protein